MKTLTTRDRRALLLGAVVLVPVVGWLWVASPYLEALELASSRLTAERELLVRELELIAESADYPVAWEQGSERLVEAAPRLFAGDNPALTGAELARYLQAGARSNRVLLTQIEPGVAEEAGTGLIAVPLHVEGETDLEGLLSMLHGLEAGGKLVRIENLSVHGLRTIMTTNPQEPEVLSFTFKATGFALSPVQQAVPDDGNGVAGQ